MLENPILITRFAPSPTGYLHLGHVASALYVFAVAKTFGARVILRIEDHDLQRSKDHYREAIIEDLTWLGLPFWQPPNSSPATSDAFSAGSKLYHFQQSSRKSDHLVILQKLTTQNKAYYCRCSRLDIRRALKSHSKNATLPYPGTCRDLDLPYEAGVTGIRLRSLDRSVSYQDAFGPRQTITLTQAMGDILLQDRLGHLTYHFAVCCDDIMQGIGLIVRGQDIESSTASQINLAREISPQFDPLYYHHVLLRGKGQVKLSKRLASEPIRELRKSGYQSTQVFAQVLAQLDCQGRSTQSIELHDAILRLQRHYGWQTPG